MRSLTSSSSPLKPSLFRRWLLSASLDKKTEVWGCEPPDAGFDNAIARYQCVLKAFSKRGDKVLEYQRTAQYYGVWRLWSIYPEAMVAITELYRISLSRSKLGGTSKLGVEHGALHVIDSGEILQHNSLRDQGLGKGVYMEVLKILRTTTLTRRRRAAIFHIYEARRIKTMNFVLKKLRNANYH
ncbi:hypothetical protein KCU61_g75, partial [Aureobasidium melanogenum]